jgi:hypothetical protein
MLGRFDWTEIDLAVVDYLWLAGGKMEMSNLRSSCRRSAVRLLA